jgi:branched-chain amino acid transport system ATP-binding protein
MAGDVPLLEVADLDAYYGNTHVLQRVAFAVDAKPTAVIGRNGMGKTTLCKAIMAIEPLRTRGSTRFDGRELLGKPPYRICGSGNAYGQRGVGSFPRFRRTSTCG